MRRNIGKHCATVCLVPLVLGLVGTPALADDSNAGAIVATASAASAADLQQDLRNSSAPNGANVEQSAAADSGADTGRRYSLEFGILPHYLDNYYQAQEDFGTALPVAAQSVTIVTVSGELKYNLIQDRDRKLTAGVRVRHNIFTDLDHANSTDVDLTLVYDAKPSLLKLGYFATRHRLVSDNGGNLVYGATNGASAEYSYRFSKRLRGRAAYRFSRQTYSSSTDRNLSEHNFSADLRYQIVPQFMPAIGFELSRGNAASSAFSFNRKAIFVSVTSELGDAVYLNVRYRRSQRNYVTSVPTDSYFGREDPRDDLSAYGTVQLGHGLSIFGFATHINNRSNQPSHRFTSNEAGLGLFYRF